MPLHDVLLAQRELVMKRWMSQVLDGVAVPDMRTLELVDHMPAFVDEIVAALRDDTAVSGPPAEQGVTAAGHGAQRLRLGFSLDAVVREFGALSESIVYVAREHGAQVTFRELHILFDCIVSGIATSVSEYTRQRDAELVRQANEHFAFVAHELRNPLASATTAFMLLKARNQLPEGSRAVAALDRGLVQTRDLVDQTLQIARIASGIELRRKETTLRALFARVEHAIAPEAEARGVTIALDVRGDDPIAIDLRLVESALGNLVGNGVKYTREGSTVTVRGRIEGEQAIIEVEDRCGGLPPGKVEEAFAPFVRLDTKQGGFGLGLAIAKQAADAHGGNIRVQNLPGTGCVFVLELPIGT